MLANFRILLCFFVSLLAFFSRSYLLDSYLFPLSILLDPTFFHFFPCPTTHLCNIEVVLSMFSSQCPKLKVVPHATAAVHLSGYTQPELRSPHARTPRRYTVQYEQYESPVLGALYDHSHSHLTVNEFLVHAQSSPVSEPPSSPSAPSHTILPQKNKAILTLNWDNKCNTF